MTANAKTHAAVADIFKDLGKPKHEQKGRVGMLLWRGVVVTRRPDPILFPDGDGLLVARSANIEHEYPGLLRLQLEELSEMARARDLRPRDFLLVSCSGLCSYDERKAADLGHIDTGAQRGRYRWVGFRDWERISRDQDVISKFLRQLQRSDTDLQLSRGGPSPHIFTSLTAGRS